MMRQYKNYRIEEKGVQQWICYEGERVIGVATNPAVFLQLVYDKELGRGIEKHLTLEMFEEVKDA